MIFQLTPDDALKAIKSVSDDFPEAMDKIVSRVPEEQRVRTIDMILPHIPKEQRIEAFNAFISQIPEEQRIETLNGIKTLMPEDKLKEWGADGTGARLLLREDPNAKLYAVAELNENGNITNIEEKPEVAKTNYTVIGVYMYDSKVFDIIRTLEPSDRGLLEVTDVSNAYIEEGTLEYDFLQGWWVDAGTSFEFLRRATNMVAESGANNLWCLSS